VSRNRWYDATQRLELVRLVALSSGRSSRLQSQLQCVSAMPRRSRYCSLWLTASFAASTAARRTNSDHVMPKRRAACRTSNALAGSSLIDIIVPSWDEAVSGSDSLAQPFSSHSSALVIGVNGSGMDLITRLAMAIPRSLLLNLEAIPLHVGREPSRNRPPDAGVLPAWFSKDRGDVNSSRSSTNKQPVCGWVSAVVTEGEPISTFYEILNEPGVDVLLDMPLVVFVPLQANNLRAPRRHSRQS
jgi:hypothetical protein